MIYVFVKLVKLYRMKINNIIGWVLFDKIKY